MKRLLTSLLPPAILCAGCATALDQETPNPVIQGTAMPVRLAPDSTWIPLTDFSRETTNLQVFWIPSWGNGAELTVQEHQGNHGVWISGQPERGFGALEIRHADRGEHVPILASTQQRIRYAMSMEGQEYRDVRIMGAFNGCADQPP